MPFGRNSSLITQEGALEGVSAWLAHPCFTSYMVAGTIATDLSQVRTWLYGSVPVGGHELRRSEMSLRASGRVPAPVCALNHVCIPGAAFVSGQGFECQGSLVGEPSTRPPPSSGKVHDKPRFSPAHRFLPILPDQFVDRWLRKDFHFPAILKRRIHALR